MGRRCRLQPYGERSQAVPLCGGPSVGDQFDQYIYICTSKNVYIICVLYMYIYMYMSIYICMNQFQVSPRRGLSTHHREGRPLLYTPQCHRRSIPPGGDDDGCACVFWSFVRVRMGCTSCYNDPWVGASPLGQDWCIYIYIHNHTYKMHTRMIFLDDSS